ncbi:hypothetical protein F5Y07DRAFT_398066 [Xylaria sp. FL0933]|nr:hypothetical protein F5Y07DRAFT_398066 [Xylaria sp. FL0933]
MPRQVGGLRVSMDAAYGAGPVRLDPTMVEYRAAAAAVDLGLYLLEIHEGHRHLPAVGLNVLTHRGHSHISPEHLHELANTFTNKLRHSFPPLFLTNWITGQGLLRKVIREGSMHEWEPSKAGMICLDLTMIQNLISVGEDAFCYPHEHKYRNAFQDFMVLMAVTIAHELVHLWVGYLTASWDSRHTPVEVDFLASYYTGDRNYGTDNHGNDCGDSGRVWEELAFGGTLEAIGEPSNRLLKAYQAGTLYCINGSGAAREVQRSWIKKFLRRSQFLATIASFISNLRANVLVSAGNFRLPFLIEDDATPNIAVLRAKTWNMNEVRKRLVPIEVRQALQGGYEMPREITREELEIYRVRAYTTRGPQYEELRRAAIEPNYLYPQLIS